MKTKRMFGVEYYVQPSGETDHTTYEIFEDIQEAKKFAGTVAVCYIFVADFDKEHIFVENGAWNYEDLNTTVNNMVVLEQYSPKGEPIEQH